MTKNNWSYEEHVVAFNLYCKIPFTKINSQYAPIEDLAQILGRTSGAVAMKMANFARLDPVLQARNISGLSQGAKGEEIVWKEFNDNWEELAYKSEQILADFQKDSIERIARIYTDDLPLEGKEREAIIKMRVNQSFFRKAVLSSYNFKCCITGIVMQDLLVAGHIVPWSHNKNLRVNPSNGICLNSLHDRAFDQGLITITPDFKVILSAELVESFNREGKENLFFLPFSGSKINIPQKFQPNKEFLEYHNDKIFRG